MSTRATGERKNTMRNQDSRKIKSNQLILASLLWIFQVENSLSRDTVWGSGDCCDWIGMGSVNL